MINNIPGSPALPNDIENSKELSQKFPTDKPTEIKAKKPVLKEADPKNKIANTKKPVKKSTKNAKKPMQEQAPKPEKTTEQAIEEKDEVWKMMISPKNAVGSPTVTEFLLDHQKPWNATLLQTYELDTTVAGTDIQIAPFQQESPHPTDVANPQVQISPDVNCSL